MRRAPRRALARADIMARRRSSNTRRHCVFRHTVWVRFTVPPAPATPQERRQPPRTTTRRLSSSAAPPMWSEWNSRRHAGASRADRRPEQCPRRWARGACTPLPQLRRGSHYGSWSPLSASAPRSSGARGLSIAAGRRSWGARGLGPARAGRSARGRARACLRRGRRPPPERRWRPGARGLGAARR